VLYKCQRDDSLYHKWLLFICELQHTNQNDDDRHLIVTKTLVTSPVLFLPVIVPLLNDHLQFCFSYWSPAPVLHYHTNQHQNKDTLSHCQSLSLYCYSTVSITEDQTNPAGKEMAPFHPDKQLLLLSQDGRPLAEYW